MSCRGDLAFKGSGNKNAIGKRRTIVLSYNAVVN